MFRSIEQSKNYVWSVNIPRKFLEWNAKRQNTKVKILNHIVFISKILKVACISIKIIIYYKLLKE